MWNHRYVGMYPHFHVIRILLIFLKCGFSCLIQRVNKVRRHYSIAYNFRSYVHSVLKLYMLKELFSIKLPTKLQLLQLNFSVIIINSSYTRRQGGGERGGSVVECQTPERDFGESKPTAAVLCP